MSISTSDSSISYVGNNSTSTAYVVNYPFFDASDLKVYSVTAGTSTLLALTTNYTVSGGNGSTGSVVTTAAIPATSTLIITRSVPYTQLTSLTTGDRLPAASLEKALDKLTMEAQQLSRGTIPDTAATSGSAPYVLGVSATGGSPTWISQATYVTTTVFNSTISGINATIAALVTGVSSVAGKVGAVTLVKADVGLGNVDNTSDVNKPISTATQSALNGKQVAGSYAPATGIAPSAITGTAVITSDSRLSDARTPTAHTHPLSALTQSSATNGQVATWNGSAWVPVSLATASITDGTVTPSKLSTGGPSWDTSGNVGIGTMTPKGKTTSVVNFGNGDSVNFNAMAAGNGQGQRTGYSFRPTFVGTSDNAPRRAADITAGFTSGWGTEYLAIGAGSNGLANDTGIETSEKVRITSTGNVGIGTSSPANKLDIQGTGAAIKVAYVPVAGNTTPAAYLFQGAGLASHITNSLTLNTNGTQIATNATGGGYNITSTGEHGFYTFNGATVGSATTVTTRFSILPDGTINTQANPILNCPTTAKAWGGGTSAGVTDAQTFNVATIARSGPGNYLVTTSQPIVGHQIVATPKSATGNQATAAAVSTTQFRVYTFGGGGAAADCAFQFVVFGD